MNVEIDIDDYLYEADLKCLMTELGNRNIDDGYLIELLNSNDHQIDFIELYCQKKNLSIIQTEKLNKFLETL